MNVRSIVRPVLVALAVAISGCQGQQANPGSGQPAQSAAPANNAEFATYQALVQRLLDSGFSQGDTTVVDSLVADDMVDHMAPFPGLPAGKAGLKQAIVVFKRGFPDVRFQIIDAAQEGDKLWVYSVMTGTNTGPFMGKKPTGKSVKVDGFDIVRFNRDKMVEHWGISDNLTMMSQLGASDGSAHK